MLKIKTIIALQDKCTRCISMITYQYFSRICMTVAIFYERDSIEISQGWRPNEIPLPAPLQEILWLSITGILSCFYAIKWRCSKRKRILHHRYFEYMSTKSIAFYSPSSPPASKPNSISQAMLLAEFLFGHVIYFQGTDTASNTIIMVPERWN